MKLISILIFGLLVYSSPINLPKSVIKKMNKTIHKTWDEENITINKIGIPDAQLDSIGINLQENQLFVVKNNSSKLGYVFLEQGKGRYDYFDFMVITDTSIVVKKVQVLIYRSENGGAISNKRWLRQFAGQSPETTFKYGNEIDAISGATLSGNAITDGVANVISQLNTLNEMGLLE